MTHPHYCVTWDGEEYVARIERKTTWGHIRGLRDIEPSDPTPPDDESDWILEGCAADDGVILWFWARYVDDEKQG